MAVTDVAQVLAAGASAVAAIAAWRASAHTGRTLRHATEPRLTTQAFHVGGQAHVDVYNVGGGVALACMYVLVVGEYKAVGYMREGKIDSGNRMRIRTAMTVDADAQVIGVVACRNTDGTVTAWDLASFHRSRQFTPERGGLPLDMQEIFDTLVPDIDLKKLESRPSDVLYPDELEALAGSPYRPPDPDPFRGVG